MADKLRLGSEVRELKIGQSFTNPKAGTFHTIRYDFKPASVDINKIATVDVGMANEVTVTVPHLDGAGVSQTIFKGPQKPFQKECVLIINRDTGEITLEKLTSTMQMKKTRSESARPLLQQDRGGNQDRSSASSGSLTSARPQTPPIGQRQSNKTRVTSGSRRADRQITNLVPKHSPLHASPNPNHTSPGHHRSPKRDREPHESHNPSTLASLPLIGIDDFVEPAPPPVVAVVVPAHATSGSPEVLPLNQSDDDPNLLTDTSSSDSSSDSDSDHDSTEENRPRPPPPLLQPASSRNGNGHSNGLAALAPSVVTPPKSMSMPTALLNEDLHLSESGSDSE